MEANELFGKPWTDVARFDSFEAADQKRNQLLKEENLQVKVRKTNTSFVVKTRSTIVEKQEQKEVKKTKDRRHAS